MSRITHIGIFEREADMLGAIDESRELDLDVVDAYTPYPIHGLDERITLLEGDLLDACDGAYDLIISNPPYVADESYEELPDEFKHEPIAALASGPQGLDHVSRILDAAGPHLTDQGLLVVEVGEAEDALVLAYPDLPFVWLEFERGGSGVFLIDRLRLVSSHRRLSGAV